MVGRDDLKGMTDAWQAYIDLAMGFTETSRKRATKVVKQLVGRGNATAEQLQTMAEELVSTAQNNREAMLRLVRFELDRALGRVGLATADEVADLASRVGGLEEKLETPAGPAPAAGTPTAAKKVARKAAKKAAPAAAPAAKSAPARAAAAKTAAPEAAVESPVPAAPASTAGAAKKTVAKKTVAKKTVAKKTAGGTR